MADFINWNSRIEQVNQQILTVVGEYSYAYFSKIYYWRNYKQREETLQLLQELVELFKTQTSTAMMRQVGIDHYSVDIILRDLPRHESMIDTREGCRDHEKEDEEQEKKWDEERENQEWYKKYKNMMLKESKWATEHSNLVATDDDVKPVNFYFTTP
jgi:hypothetical protein